MEIRIGVFGLPSHVGSSTDATLGGFRTHPSPMLLCRGVVFALAVLSAGVSAETRSPSLLNSADEICSTPSTYSYFDVGDGGGSNSGSYDLTAGTLEASAYASSGSQIAGISMTDLYVVANLPTGTPVTFTAQITASGGGSGGSGAGGYGEVSALIREGEANEASQSWGGYLDVPLQVTVNSFAGYPIQIYFEMFAAAVEGGTSQSASVSGQVQFLDLPSGAVVTSCHAFFQGTRVGVEEGSADPPFAVERVGPNPAQGPFAVTVMLPTDAPASLAIFDVAGRLVQRSERLTRGRQTVQFGDDRPLPSGVYFIRLAQGAHIAWAKQIILR